MASIKLLPKSDKKIIRKKLYFNIIHEHRHKKTKQNFNKSNQTTFKKIINHNQVGFIPGMQGWFNVQQSSDVFPY